MQRNCTTSHDLASNLCFENRILEIFDIVPNAADETYFFMILKIHPKNQFRIFFFYSKLCDGKAGLFQLWGMNHDNLMKTYSFFFEKEAERHSNRHAAATKEGKARKYAFRARRYRETKTQQQLEEFRGAAEGTFLSQTDQVWMRPCECS